MYRMIWCGYVQNFWCFLLVICLSTYYSMLFTDFVDSYFLIINGISSLSTILFSGAKLISLYLFRAKMSGKVIKNYVFYAPYPLNVTGRY